MALAANRVRPSAFILDWYKRRRGKCLTENQTSAVVAGDGSHVALATS